MMTLRELGAGIKKYAAIIYVALVAGLYLLWRKEKDLHYEAEAKQLAAEKRGEINELEKQTKDAERAANDSAAAYDELARPHRD